MKKPDELYYSYLTPSQAKAERTLSTVLWVLIAATFVAAFVITLLSPRDDSTMVFLGMFLCEACLFLMRSGVIPLYEIQFIDHKKKPDVKLRDNVILWLVGLGFLLFIGYLMMAVGVVNFITELKEG